LPDENADFNLSDLEGTKVQLVVEHNQTEDGTFANIAAIIRPKTKAEEVEEARSRKIIDGVKRKTQTVIAASAPARPEINDEDIPF
jgi:hypothetical protein